ncbi:MAG: ABC transporter substrate-binding protein [Gammaproteobacteria bacterium]|nr:ABC transporter substrate-binding protein [Gammaproteobacteria bacterium]
MGRLYKLVIVFAVLLTGCEGESVETLKVGTSLWPGYEPLFLGKRHGHFNNSEITFVEYPVPAGAVRALINGSVQAATLTMDEVLKIKEVGVPIKVVLVINISEGGDVILARQGIRSVKDLKGKRVANEGSVLAQYLLARALEINGLSLADIRSVRLSSTMHETVFTDGGIDAVVTYEPAKTKLIRNGAAQIFSSADIPGEIVDVLVVTEKYLATHPEVVKDLVDGWYLSLATFDSDKVGAARIINERMHVGEAAVLASFDGMILPDRKRTNALLSGDDSHLYESLRGLAKTMRNHDLLKTNFDPVQLLNNDYVK